MEKKNKKLYVIFLIFIVILSIGIVEKSMQNDTFFTIAIARDMIDRGGLDGLDHLTQHEGLNFTHSGWIFDLIIYGAYSALGFFGIYLVTIIVSIIIFIVLFNVFLKEENNIVLSFIFTIVSIFISRGVLAARGQIFSFLIFVLELYAIVNLTRTGKKRYIISLLVLPIILANTHDTVWPFYFVLFLPYIAEAFFSKIEILLNKEESYKVEVKEVKYWKTLLIIMVISAFTGLITPVFGTAYINLFTVMAGVSKNFISELQQVDLLSTLPLLTIVVFTIGVVGFTKTKIRLKDLLFVFGFVILSLMAIRNCFFLYLLGIVSVCNIFTKFLKTYGKEMYLEYITDIIVNNKIYLFLISILIILISVTSFVGQIEEEYVNDFYYPVEAVEWMKKNINFDEMTIYNGFNYGSYLELNGIKVFMDSRSGMYCEEFTEGSTIMTDYLNVESGTEHYEKTFKNYGITHALIYNETIINQYISEDLNYECIYQDDIFALYERVK